MSKQGSGLAGMWRVAKRSMTTRTMVPPATQRIGGHLRVENQCGGAPKPLFSEPTMKTMIALKTEATYSEIGGRSQREHQVMSAPKRRQADTVLTTKNRLPGGVLNTQKLRASRCLTTNSRLPASAVSPLFACVP